MSGQSVRMASDTVVTRYSRADLRIIAERYKYSVHTTERLPKVLQY